MLLVSSYMKYALFGDIHERGLGDLEKAFTDLGVDAMMCTSDHDSPESAHESIGLEGRFTSAGKKVYTVPGNHDYATLMGHVITHHKNKNLPKKLRGMANARTSMELYERLKNDPVAHEYILNLFKKNNSGLSRNRIKMFLDEERFEELYKTMLVHGAPFGDMSSFPDCPDRYRNVWARLKSKKDFKTVFNGMNRNGYKILVRGHDHDARCVSEGENGKMSSYRPRGDGDGYRLDPEKRHIINPGALSGGSFATIDTNEGFLILRYYKL